MARCAMTTQQLDPFQKTARILVELLILFLLLAAIARVVKVELKSLENRWQPPSPTSQLTLSEHRPRDLHP
jgi:hypothetical protein